MIINNVILSSNSGYPSSITVEAYDKPFKTKIGYRIANIENLKFILPKPVSKSKYGGTSMSVTGGDDDCKVVINGFNVKLIDKNTLQFKKGSVKYLSYRDSLTYERVGSESLFKKIAKLFS